MQGIFDISGLSFLLVGALILSAKMMAEFSMVYIPFMAGVVLKKKLFHRYSNGNGLEFSADPVVQREDLFFKKLNEIIQKNIGNENFNIQVLCIEMGMSKSQLYRKFKALTNKSVARYIRSRRMRKAMELLQTSSMNISEVGYGVGIKTPSTFSELFKDEFGKSPREFENPMQCI